MDKNNSGWLKMVIIILIVVNIASLAAVWVLKFRKTPRRDHPVMAGGDVSGFIIRELALDSAQATRFRALRDAHRDSVEEVKSLMREEKDRFFNLVSDTTLSDAALEAASMRVAKVESRLDQLTLRHFKQLRAICRPDQQEKLDEMISDLLHSMAQPPGGPMHGQGPPGGHPPHGAGGPPPPPGAGPPPQ